MKQEEFDKIIAKRILENLVQINEKYIDFKCIASDVCVDEEKLQSIMFEPAKKKYSFEWPVFYVDVLYEMHLGHLVVGMTQEESFMQIASYIENILKKFVEA